MQHRWCYNDRAGVPEKDEEQARAILRPLATGRCLVPWRWGTLEYVHMTNTADRSQPIRDQVPAENSRVALFCFVPQMYAWVLVTVLSTDRMTSRVWTDLGVYENWNIKFHSMAGRPGVAATTAVLGLGAAIALCIGSRAGRIRRAVLLSLGLLFCSLLLAWTRRVTGIFMGFYDDPWQNDLDNWLLMTGIGPLCVHLVLRCARAYRSLPLAEIAHVFLLSSALCLDIYLDGREGAWPDVILLTGKHLALSVAAGMNLLLLWGWWRLPNPRAAFGPAFIAVVSTLHVLVLARKLGCFIEWV